MKALTPSPIYPYLCTITLWILCKSNLRFIPLCCSFLLKKEICINIEINNASQLKIKGFVLCSNNFSSIVRQKTFSRKRKQTSQFLFTLKYVRYIFAVLTCGTTRNIGWQVTWVNKQVFLSTEQVRFLEKSGFIYLTKFYQYIFLSLLSPSGELLVSKISDSVLLYAYF